MKGTIETILTQFGPSVLLTENRFCAIVEDLAPKDKSFEKKVIRRMAQTHLLQVLYQEVFSKQGGKDNGTALLLVKLQAEGFPEDWARTALEIFGLDAGLPAREDNAGDSFSDRSGENNSKVNLLPPSLSFTNSAAADSLRKGFFALDNEEWDEAKAYFNKALNVDRECAEAYLGLTLVELHCVDLTRFQALCSKYGLPESENWESAADYATGDLRKWVGTLLEADAHKQSLADQVGKAFESRLSRSQAPSAKELLDEEIIKADSLEKLLDGFDAIIKEEAKTLADIHACENEESQLRAQRAQLGIFKGKEKRSIDDRLSLLASQKAELSVKAAEAASGKKGFASKAAVSQALERSKSSIQEYRLRIENESKQTGISFDEAMDVYRHDFSVRKIMNARDPILGIKIDLLSGNETITIGSYWQAVSEIPLPIEWLVLKNTGKRALVISKNCLDSMAFNDRRADFTWETCTLRKWLNGEFFNTAFSTKEQALVARVTVPAVNNELGHAQAGNDTIDRVFVLNVPEAESYFKNDAARACAGTEYCILRGAKKEKNGNVDWWLRTPGGIQSTATSVTETGYVASGGYFGDTIGTAVRPAMWIDIAE